MPNLTKIALANAVNRRGCTVSAGIAAVARTIEAGADLYADAVTAETGAARPDAWSANFKVASERMIDSYLAD